MRLTLGNRSFDLATRALVVGVLGSASGADLPRRTEQLVEEGADVIEVSIEVGTATDMEATVKAVVGAAGPAAVVGVSVPAGCADLARAGYAAGAVLGAQPSPSLPFLEASARAGAAVVVSCRGDELDPVRSALVECARRAESAGLPSERVIVEPVLDRHLLAHLRRFAELGYPLLLTPPPHDGGAIAPATMTLGVIGGCRLIRTGDVRAARRVRDVLAAVLEAE